ncbi:group 1 glycosyl transferase [Salinisphaera hydrothermalis EPR70]
MGRGGAERVTLFLIEAFIAKGYLVDLVLHEKTGPYISRVPEQVRIIVLSSSNAIITRCHMLYAFLKDRSMFWPSLTVRHKHFTKLRYLPSFTRYLKENQPDVCIAILWPFGLTAICARALARVNTRIIATFHSAFSVQSSRHRSMRSQRSKRWQCFRGYCAKVYLRADALVAVSLGVADDLATTLKIPRDRVEVIYNPVISNNNMAQAKEPLSHLWFKPDAPPVIVAVGKLSVQKGFDTLLKAFARVYSKKNVRLVILGEGQERQNLEALRHDLGLDDVVDLPGWVDNPSAFMYRADMFVLSSRWEGLGNVLIEAMACGCPVVATDCPHGPAEILANGRYGKLVLGLEDPALLADAISETLSAVRNPAILTDGITRFTVEQATETYHRLVARLIEPKPIRSASEII